ncbi:unnamed protein product [Fraxinus pennsylvanica]|uniref:Uncharacterized protein n=1 Tax=Fraxinus pennsylvanica TaxID=56036 RepID=A0AAD2E2Q9_9LAMI|nr:unnamed protein product [Fraxinus pennsylvanica]
MKREDDGELKEEKSVKNGLSPTKNFGVLKLAKNVDHEWNPSSPSCRSYKITQKALSLSQFHALDSSSPPRRNYEITSKAPSASSGHRLIIEPCYVEELELKVVSGLIDEVELKLSEYKEVMKKENRELENRVVSLTEENRDINSLLRIALAEKEALKKLNRVKGNNEQKRIVFLQIAERGLQKVGFGFMIGNKVNEQLKDNPEDKSDGSESEEEAVSLASTVEKITKNLRLEITQLRTSLEESRSDALCLQSIADKQAKKLAEDALRIEKLENREMLLTENVEALLAEIKETVKNVVQ